MSRREWAILGVIAVAVVVLVAIVWLSGRGGPGAPASAQPGASASVTASASAATASAPGSASGVPSTQPSAAAGAAPTIAWEQLAGPEPDATVLGMAFVEGRWFALGQTSRGPGIWFSEDAGSSWTAATMPAQPEGESAVVTDLVAFGGELYASGSWGRAFTDQSAWVLWRSSDGGLTWTESREDQAAFSALIQAGAGLVGAGYEGLVTPSTAWVALSDDGQGWSRIDSPAFAASAILSLATLEERLVAIGFLGPNGGGGSRPAAWFSDDGGENWQAGTVEGTGSMLGIVQAERGLVAVGGDGIPTAWLSSDGATWSSVVFGEAGTPRAIAAMAGGLVAVGSSGSPDTGVEQAWTSADGESWAPSEMGGDGSASILAAASDGGTVLAGGFCLVEGCDSVIWRGTMGE